MKQNRRNFLRTATIGAGVTFIPSWLSAGIIGPSPNDKINIGVIGTGKQALGLFRRCGLMPDAKVVAACDVYLANLERFATAVKTKYAEATGSDNYGTIPTYSDYRELLDHPDLDAVIIATPDHQHAQMCIDALDKGLHVYCEKPLAHTIEEGRAIVDAVERNKRVLQTGSMQRSMRTFQRAVALVQEGALGELKEATVSIGRPARPFDLPGQPLPAGLNWEQWVGPSVERPYHPTLVPESNGRQWGAWRDYAEYGGGMITDWGAHMFDIVQWARGKDDSGPVQFFPPGGDAEYGLTMFYDDDFKVVHQQFGRGNAVRFIGTEGTLDVARGYIDSSIPGLVGYEDTNKAMKVPTNIAHFQDFYDAILKGTALRCPAETGHRTSSMCTLANIAYRLRQPLSWDPENEKITNNKKANALLGPAYRLSLA
ncbi:MAG: Gfo/Idh/MocA family oxidoreductase [Bacteroidota bacterium]